MSPHSKIQPHSRTQLRSRRIVTPDGLVDGTVVVSEGRIESVRPASSSSASLASSGDAEDLGDLAILPGAVDPHVHLNEPGRADWEGFETGTRAAAAGGITTLVDMPLNSLPVTTTVAALDAKRAAARGRCLVEVLFHGGLVPGNLHEIEPLVDSGVVGVKAFLCHSGIDEFPAVGEADLRPAMKILARCGVPLLAHAELEEFCCTPPGDPNAYASWLACRPCDCETRAIDLLIRLCRETGCRVHVVHLATADALPPLRAARGEGLPITVETCPHYLTFAAEDLPDGDPRFKCAPPIREERHREALWQALADGPSSAQTLDFVASDHSPAPPSLKTGDLMSAWGGIASLQVSLSATWTGARQRGHGLDDLARWMSSAPARLLGLEARKGAIATGFDADLVVFDPDAQWTVRGGELEHRHPQTAYEGRKLRGRVVRTYVAGRRVWPFDGGSKRP